MTDSTSIEEFDIGIRGPLQVEDALFAVYEAALNKRASNEMVPNGQ